jgi:hypothetical protein
LALQHRCPAAGNRFISRLIPAMMVCAANRPTPGISLSCAAASAEGCDLGLDLGDIGLGWMLPGGHGSADPGLGMNRAQDQLYLAVWLSCVGVGCGLAGNDVVCFP